MIQRLSLQMNWQRSRLESGWFLIRILARTPTISTEHFSGVPLPGQANARIVSRLVHDRFLPHPLQLIDHPVIGRYTI
jgi:hypothetical protein